MIKSDARGSGARDVRTGAGGAADPPARRPGGEGPGRAPSPVRACRGVCLARLGAIPQSAICLFAVGVHMMLGLAQRGGGRRREGAGLAIG